MHFQLLSLALILSEKENESFKDFPQLVSKWLPRAYRPRVIILDKSVN